MGVEVADEEGQIVTFRVKAAKSGGTVECSVVASPAYIDTATIDASSYEEYRKKWFQWRGSSSEYLISVAWQSVKPSNLYPTSLMNSLYGQSEPVEIEEEPAPPTTLSFVLVSEQGWKSAAESNFIVEKFDSEEEAMVVATPLWCCWCLFKELSNGSYEEATSGGIGFAWTSIRTFVREKLQGADGDVVTVGEAAEETEALAPTSNRLGCFPAFTESAEEAAGDAAGEAAGEDPEDCTDVASTSNEFSCFPSSTKTAEDAPTVSDDNADDDDDDDDESFDAWVTRSDQPAHS